MDTVVKIALTLLLLVGTGFLVGIALMVVNLVGMLISGAQRAAAESQSHGLLTYHRETQFDVKPVIPDMAAIHAAIEEGMAEAGDGETTIVIGPAGAATADIAPAQEQTASGANTAPTFAAGFPAHIAALFNRKRVAVIEFTGDMLASGRDALAAHIDEIEINRTQFCEVVIVVNSPGGAVANYGQAFSEIERLRDLNIPVTVCVDTVAASGGYLMSLPANRIVAAPFAYVGSVGVVAMVPNLTGLANMFGVKPRVFTAGRYKRTVHQFDDDSPEVREHFQKSLQSIHDQFLAVVRKYRPNADMEQVETGDHWTAAESQELKLGLVDEIGTSSSYLLRRNREAELVFIKRKESPIGRVLEKLGDRMALRFATALSAQFGPR